MRPILIALLLCVPIYASDVPIDILVAIEKAKAGPVVPTPAKSSASWQSYSAARASHIENRKPLVVLLGMEGCAPCKSLKKSIEAESFDANFAYVDVQEESATAAMLGYSGSFTVPKMVLVYFDGAKSLLSRPDQSNAIASIKAACGVATSIATAVASKAATYSYRVERIARPVGFQPAYVAGQTFYTHITRDHGHQIREVLNRVDIRGMSQDELFSLHSALHSGISVGYWDGRCFVFQLP